MSSATLVNLVHFDGTDFVMDTDVDFDPDQEVTSLSGATATIKAKSRSSPSSVVIDGTVIVDVPNSRLRSTFLPGDLNRGVYDLQLSVTISGNTKMLLYGTLNVKDSF